MKRIGYLSAGWPVSRWGLSQAFLNAFEAGLAEMHWIEGENVEIVPKFAEGNPDLFPRLVDDLLNRGKDGPVDVIAVISTQAIMPVQRATEAQPVGARTPAVLADSFFPKIFGNVRELHEPGGNITGLYLDQEQLTPLRLRWLKTILPKTRSLAVMHTTAEHPDTSIEDSCAQLKWEIAERAATQLGLEFQRVEVPMQNEDPQEIAYQVARVQADVLFVMSTYPLRRQRAVILKAASEKGLPVVAEAREWPRDGALTSYGPDRAEMCRQAGHYVAAIIGDPDHPDRGRDPGALPMNGPAVLEVVLKEDVAKLLKARGVEVMDASVSDIPPPQGSLASPIMHGVATAVQVRRVLLP